MTSLAIISVTLLFVFFTSLLSGVIGMAGGMVLMAFLGSFFSVPVAMVVHGWTQAFANGYRSFLSRRHIRWDYAGLYILGLFVAYGLFELVAFKPTRQVVFFFLGLLPLVTFFKVNKTRWITIESHFGRFICGLFVQVTQLLAGASGPLLDIFFQNSSLNRHEIVATKGLFQTIGHIAKILYFLPLLDASARATFPDWFFVAAIILSGLGTQAGKVVLDRLSDIQFRKYSRWAILCVGIVCLYKAITITS